jgi:PEGA domain-containing protein
MRNDDNNKVARLKPTPHPGRGRPEPESSRDTAGRGQLIQVATRCATLDEFVEKFAGFAWESSLVLPAATALPVGTQGRFVILLRDQTIAMRGRCRVTEAKQTPASSRNPAVKRIMMRVALLEMDEASRVVHRRLMALRSAPVPLPIPSEPSETTQIEPARQGSAPMAVPAAVPAPPVKTPPPAPPININRTMIGVGVGPDGRAFLAQPAPAPVPPAAAPPEPEPTEPRARIPTLRRVETRAPGSPYTLPANPLSEFGADDVDSFIECTLLEADAEMGTGIADAPPPAAEAGGDTNTRATAHIRLQRLIARLPPSLRGKPLRVAPYAAIAVVGLSLGYALHGKPPPPPPIAKPTPAQPLQARVPEPEIKPLEAKIEAPMQAAIPPRAEPRPAPAKPARPQQPAPAIADLTPAAAPAKPAAAAAQPIAVAKPSAVAKAAAPSPSPSPSSSPPEGRGNVEIAPDDRLPAPIKVAAVEKPAPAAKPAAPAAPAVVAGTPGACTARVVTEPKDAKVIWGDQVIGRSPIDDVKVPCGPAKVTVERERWQPVTVDVTLQAGDTAVVRQRLHRPRGMLVISSSPPGAQITVNRVAAGTTPKQVDVQRFEKVPIKVSLKGHQPWSKTVYLKETETKIDVQLVPRK